MNVTEKEKSKINRNCKRAFRHWYNNEYPTLIDTNIVEYMWHGPIGKAWRNGWEQSEYDPNNLHSILRTKLEYSYDEIEKIYQYYMKHGTLYQCPEVPSQHLNAELKEFN